MQDVPPGFEPIGSRSAFFELIGPLQARLRDGRAVVGLRLQDKHCNTSGYLHGGMVGAIFDSCFGLNVGLDVARMLEEEGRARSSDASGPPMVTVSLTTEYLGSARCGDWIEASAVIQRPGRSLAFVSGELTQGENVIAKGSGIFRVFVK